jgi:hypothetical protein
MHTREQASRELRVAFAHLRDQLRTPEIMLALGRLRASLILAREHTEYGAADQLCILVAEAVLQMVSSIEHSSLICETAQVHEAMRRHERKGA